MKTNKLVNSYTTKDCHDFGYVTAIISADVAQHALNMKCTTILVILWTF
jgi:hypothetical protein